MAWRLGKARRVTDDQVPKDSLGQNGRGAQGEVKMLDYDSATPPITQVQRLHLELLRTVRYNEFDGEAIVRDLLAHRD